MTSNPEERGKSGSSGLADLAMAVGKTLVAATCCMFLAGCATLINGTHQKLPVTSHPSGATVRCGEDVYETPCVLELARNKDYALTISKDGYYAEPVPLTRVPTGVTHANWWIGGLIGFTVDAITQADKKFVPESVDAILARVEGEESPLEDQDEIVAADGLALTGNVD